MLDKFAIAKAENKTTTISIHAYHDWLEYRNGCLFG